MNNKKTRNEIHAEKIGESVAKNMFLTMLEPQYQSKNFTWEKFPENCKTFCKSQVTLGFRDNVKNLEYLQQIAILAYIEEGNKLKEEYQEKKYYLKVKM